LPFACDLELVLRVRERLGPVVLSSKDGSPERFVDGVISALGAQVRGCEGTIHSTIPVGAGLSSSAALTAAVAFAVTGGRPPTIELLQRAEHIATGVPIGVMDQTAILRGRAGHAMLVDCATGELEYVAIPPSVAFVVIDTGTRRELADGRYAERRAEVEAGEPRRRRHAASEQERVLAAVDALRAGDPDTLGSLVSDSHASLRDDFEVSSNELDLAVEAAEAHPAGTGARLVGAGFAGCVLAVTTGGDAGDVATFAVDRLRDRLPGVRAWEVTAVDGAGEVVP
jgi:galactokinase